MRFPVTGGICSTGAGNEKTNLEYAGMILTTPGMDEDRITFVPGRAGHDFPYSFTTEKIRGPG